MLAINPVPPKINHVTSGGHLQVKKGSPVRLECSASGNPMPNITWTRKNNLLPNGMLKKFSFFDNFSATHPEPYKDSFRPLRWTTFRAPDTNTPERFVLSPFPSTIHFPLFVVARKMEFLVFAQSPCMNHTHNTIIVWNKVCSGFAMAWRVFLCLAQSVTSSELEKPRTHNECLTTAIWCFPPSKASFHLHLPHGWKVIWRGEKHLGQTPEKSIESSPILRLRGAARPECNWRLTRIGIRSSEYLLYLPRHSSDEVHNENLKTIFAPPHPRSLSSTT